MPLFLWPPSTPLLNGRQIKHCCLSHLLTILYLMARVEWFRSLLLQQEPEPEPEPEPDAEARND